MDQMMFPFEKQAKIHPKPDFHVKYSSKVKIDFSENLKSKFLPIVWQPCNLLSLLSHKNIVVSLK